MTRNIGYWVRNSVKMRNVLSVLPSSTYRISVIGTLIAAAVISLIKGAILSSSFRTGTIMDINAHLLHS
jgi:hypothetical protein